ncbi:MAG TPA: hypothetical protein VLF09_03085 [Cellvibrio sp.]|nr:hypothetical protein [Cellvibrio sp.]
MRTSVIVLLAVLAGCAAERPGNAQLTFGERPPRWVPLYEGSQLSVDADYDYYPATMNLSDGGALRSADWDGFLKAYADRIPANKRDIVITGLARCSVEQDNVDKFIRFEPLKLLSGPYGKNSFVAVEGKLYPNYTVDAKLTFLFHGDRYVFANRVTVVADDFRWDSPTLVFARAHYTTVVESGSIDIHKPGVRGVIEKIINSKTATVRFDSLPTTDFVVTDRMREDMKAVLAAVDAIDGGI